MEQGEPILVRRASQGDRQAFSALVEHHWTPLVRLARSVVGDDEAEDAVQDGLLAAWRRLSGLRDPRAFPAWLTRIVMRNCLSRARRWRPRWPLSQAPEPRVEADPGGRLDVRRLLSALAPRQRAVLHLTVIEGMSDSEIAAVMKITAASVRSHRRRARERLGQLLNGVASP